jgi:polyphosphate glucokinase
MKSPILAIDIGGSYIKAGLVDTAAGRIVGAVSSKPMPAGATPDAVMEVLVNLCSELPAEGPVGLTYPGVVKNGIAWTAANVDDQWIGKNVRSMLERRIARPVAFVNDADAAGIAEMRLGAGRDRVGTVMVLTLGTGIGSALFVDGRLVPNMEFGHLEVMGQEAEHRASAKVRIDRGLSWQEWSEAVNEVLATYHALLWPDLFIIGGGVTENWNRFGTLLRCRAEILRAYFGNDAGLIGAAMLAAADARSS